LYLKSIRLINFRNYRDQRFAFRPQGAVVVGANGSGKTNLLEAIAYSGTGKSVRFHHDEQLVLHDTDFFSIISDYQSLEGSSDTIALSYQQNKKLLRVNNNPVRQLSYLFQSVKVTYLSPDDIVIINGSPRYRRQYFDLAIAQVFPEYITHYRDYLHILHQRNALLKREFSESEMEMWDRQFINVMAVIVSYRERYLNLLNDAVRSLHARISTVLDGLSVTPHANGYEWMGLNFNTPQMSKVIRQIRHREKAIQRSLIGAHLDEYSIRFGGRSLRYYGSQGQKRIAIIVLKMVHAQLIEKVTHIKPIMLFDDILAELDDRNIQLVKALVNCTYQTFIASPSNAVTHVWKDLPVIELTKIESKTGQAVGQ